MATSDLGVHVDDAARLQRVGENVDTYWRSGRDQIVNVLASEPDRTEFDRHDRTVRARHGADALFDRHRSAGAPIDREALDAIVGRLTAALDEVC